MLLHGKSVRSWCYESSDRSFMVDPLSYFSFQPVATAGLLSNFTIVLYHMSDAT